jgi:DNA-binding FadR family transcriptional regulator
MRNFPDVTEAIPQEQDHQGCEDQVWAFMIEYQEKQKMPPTMEEIAEFAGSLSYRASARYVLQRLEVRGLVETRAEPGMSRRYHAVEPTEKLPDMPFELNSTPSHREGAL